MWCLGPLRAGDRPPRDLTEGETLVGRGPDCGIRLEDPRVSRRHARLEVTRDRVRVEDLGSRHGVSVNGSRVQEATLQPGDEVGFGPLAFVLTRLEAGGEAMPPAAGAEPQDRAEGSQILERGRLAPVPPPDTRRLQVLYAIVHTLVANLHLEEILPSVLETLRDLFAYDRCAIAGRGEGRDLTTWASYPPGAAPFSRTIADRVLEEGEALLCDDIQGESPFALSESIVGLDIRSVLCSPLVFRGQVRGLIYLDRSVAAAYTLDDLALLHHVCDLVAIALENARLYTDLQGRFRENTERLRETQARLIESERIAALGRLTQALAHEVRNPVAVIGGMSRRLAKHLGDQEASRDAEAIVAEAERLEGTLQQVEKVIELPDPDFRLAPLEDDLDRVLAELRPLLEARGVRPEVRSQLGGRPVPHDPGLTRAAVAAVLGKACASAPAGGTLHVGLAETPSGWAVRISDAPPDEADGERRSFFDPFFRAHPWADDLGLTLATTAMARQGGELRLGTDPQHGTDLELVLSATAPQEVRTGPQDP